MFEAFGGFGMRFPLAIRENRHNVDVIGIISTSAFIGADDLASAPRYTDDKFPGLSSALASNIIYTPHQL